MVAHSLYFPPAQAPKNFSLLDGLLMIRWVEDGTCKDGLYLPPCCRVGWVRLEVPIISQLSQSTVHRKLCKSTGGSGNPQGEKSQ